VSSDFRQQFWIASHTWWREQKQTSGAIGAGSLLLRELWGFVRDSTPERRRSRYGDMEYDWEQRVNTTSGTVGWRERLLGVFHSPYQPTDPAAFREMMAALPIDFCEFTFVDLGSGKGRTLLMATEYPFRKIMGVEVIAELHQAAEQNVAAYRARTPATQTPAIETVCMDARDFVFPETPLLVYLFNPLPETGLRRVLQNLERSWQQAPRPVWIVYHNPLLESVMMEPAIFAKERGELEYSVYKSG
jgi:SAM-dependent methyltransferase